jgi:hypothetical protein
MRSDFINLTNKTFGRWTVLGLDIKGNRKQTSASWLCKCICGTERIVLGSSLKRGNSNGCGCIKEAKRLRPFEAIYNRIFKHSKNPVSLSYEEFTEFTCNNECHYCGCSIGWEKFNPERLAYNLDRKDNSLGYSKENCVVCCKECNYIKGARFTYVQMLQIGNLIKVWRNEGEWQ